MRSAYRGFFFLDMRDIGQFATKGVKQEALITRSVIQVNPRVFDVSIFGAPADLNDEDLVPELFELA
jgi:hypothetical protein